jgi:hypothetical protein
MQLTIVDLFISEMGYAATQMLINDVPLEDQTYQVETQDQRGSVAAQLSCHSLFPSGSQNVIKIIYCLPRRGSCWKTEPEPCRDTFRQ